MPSFVLVVAANFGILQPLIGDVDPGHAAQNILAHANLFRAGAYLWLKSGFVPRALAIFGILASAWCAGCTLVLLVFPDFSKAVNLWLFDSPMVLFEIGLSLLLLFRGLRASGPTQNRP